MSKNSEAKPLLAAPNIFHVLAATESHGASIMGDGDGGAFGISGLATDRFSQTRGRRLVFVSDNKIVGYGASLGGFSAEKNNILFVQSGSSGVQQSEIEPKKDSDKWLGFGRQPRNGASIDVYALDNGANMACHLATVEVPER